MPGERHRIRCSDSVVMSFLPLHTSVDGMLCKCQRLGCFYSVLSETMQMLKQILSFLQFIEIGALEETGQVS